MYCDTDRQEPSNFYAAIIVRTVILFSCVSVARGCTGCMYTPRARTEKFWGLNLEG